MTAFHGESQGAKGVCESQTRSPPPTRCMRLFDGALLAMSQGAAVKGELLHVQASSNPSFPQPSFSSLCAVDNSNTGPEQASSASAIPLNHHSPPAALPSPAKSARWPLIGSSRRLFSGHFEPLALVSWQAWWSAARDLCGTCTR